VALNDELRATQIRRLRDQLAVEAQTVLDEIEARFGLSRLPEAQMEPWNPHHERLFRYVLGFAPDELALLPAGFPKTVVQAALEWAE